MSEQPRTVDALGAALARERAARQRAEERQAALAGDLRVLYQRGMELAARLDQAYVETIAGLARAVEARDEHTGSHVERVRLHSVTIAERLGVSGDERRQIEFGALLHDIGKIGVPDSVLAKPGPLTPEEWTAMRAHPEIGARVLSGIDFLVPAVSAVLTHHERWDGTGYPRGLRGTEIPLAGRIVAVADAYDAMTSGRPYRRGLSPAAARAELERQRGQHFSPEAVDAFLWTRAAFITSGAA
jgi:HD-GYP domain-containing protein (c-di-GMP phosphodiesterase class II)